MTTQAWGLLFVLFVLAYVVYQIEKAWEAEDD